MYLAKNLRYLRLKHGFSQDYIADKHGTFKVFNYYGYLVKTK